MRRKNTRRWAIGSGGVILATGYAALLQAIQFSQPTLLHTLFGVALVILTLAAAFALSRFEARHGDEIGEVRFDTRNKDERDA